MFRHLTLLATLLFVGVMLSGCKSDKSAAEDTARTAMQAVTSGDTAGFTAALSEKARAKFEEGKIQAPVLKNVRTEDYKIGDAIVNDPTAVVPMTIKSSARTVQVSMQMRKEAGEWRLCALSFPLEETGIIVTYDYEAPDDFAGTVGHAMGSALNKAFTGFVKGVTGH